MSKKFGKTAAAVMLGTTLLGGVFVEVSSALTTTQAQAATKIPYSTYMSDLSGIKAALAKASSETQADVADELPSAQDYQHAYETYGDFDDYLNYNGLNVAVQDNTYSKATAQANLDCIVATYKVFKNRLSTGAQSQLDSLGTKIQQEINASSGSDDFNDIADEEDGYVDSLDSALVDYGGNYDGVAAKPKAAVKKSTITKLSAKKTASKKYVKVTGTAKLYKSANYAHIKTYKGYRYAKLSKKHTFSKTIYAPKAKTVRVSVGHYAGGHFKAVTASKTVHVK